MPQNLEDQVAARAEASGISPRTALLLETGSLAVRHADGGPSEADVQARAAASGISPDAARFLLGGPAPL